MVENFITYIRTRNFIAPELEKRYFRIFGDLEYDLLALRTETSVMALRVREVKRRVTSCIWISTEEERQISVTSHELNEHLYNRMERFHARMAQAKSFRYDRNVEQQGYYLFYDIATAVLGINDAGARLREREKLEEACDAYGRLDIPALIDLHDGVQDLLSLPRREEVEQAEIDLWERQLAELYDRYPFRHIHALDSPDEITTRLLRLKRTIAREQERLEILGMTYTAAIRAMRFRN